MVDYKCFRCGYVATQKINMKHHLNRKNICKPILEDISIENIKKHYGFEILQTTGKNSRLSTGKQQVMHYTMTTGKRTGKQQAIRNSTGKQQVTAKNNLNVNFVKNPSLVNMD